MKGGADGGEYGFRLLTVVVAKDEDGDDETTCVVEFTDSSRQSLATQQGPTGKTQKAIMDQFRTMAELSPDGTVTEHELAVVIAAGRPFDPTPGKRDKRVDNAKRRRSGPSSPVAFCRWMPWGGSVCPLLDLVKFCVHVIFYWINWIKMDQNGSDPREIWIGSDQPSIEVDPLIHAEPIRGVIICKNYRVESNNKIILQKRCCKPQKSCTLQSSQQKLRYILNTQTHKGNQNG
jgi:hypothetical protein